MCTGPAAHVVQGSDVSLVIGDKVHVSTSVHRKTISIRQGSRGRGLGAFVAGVFDTATLEPVDWLWLWQTPVAIKDASESGVVRLAL